MLALAEQAWWIALPVAVATGVVLGGSPLAWPVVVASVAVATGTGDRDAGSTRRVLVGIGAGVTLVYAVLGAAVGALDTVVRGVLGAGAGALYVVLAVLAVAAGTVLIRRPALACRARRRRPRLGRGADVVLGISLAAVTCPACAGIVTGVALIGATAGGVPVAVLAMVGLGVGHTLALVLVGGAVGRLGRLARDPELVGRVAGGALLLTGAFFVFQAAAGGVDVAVTLP